MPVTEHITIALLHEPGLLRAAIGRMISEREDRELVADVADASEFKRAFALRSPPDMVLLSLHYVAMMPWMARHMPEAHLVVLGTALSDEEQVALFREGAHGYCSTACGPEELHAIIDHVRKGAIHFSPTAWTHLRGLLPAPVVRDASLSKGQEEFLRLLGKLENPTYEHMAKEMGVGLSMVYKHRNNLCARFKLKGKSALVRFAMAWFAGRA